MALNRKYANLPDLDSAPDIYETPELTDDNSTIPTTAARTQSDDEFYDVDDNDEEAISRSRLRIGEARSRFQPTNVDAATVDFSDRVDGKRKSYKASSRRHRILQDGTYELGDLSDDDDEESLERRIARLKREVQEAKDEHARLKESEKDGELQNDSRLESLSQALENISSPIGVSQAAKPAPAESDDDSKLLAEPSNRGSTYTVTYAPSYEQSHALAKAADFDRRLVLLERGLGINASSSAETGESGLPRSMLPTLDTLEKQIQTLAQASTANLDAISRRVRTLATEQDKLNDSREKAKNLRDELGKGGDPASDTDEDTKVNALYGILPTIESLTPMLPPLLDRLRSLRAMHADAANASETLDQIEQRQAEMTSELKQWREGLEKLNGAMKEGDSTVKGNMTVMEGWVKGLEERMAKLGQ